MKSVEFLKSYRMYQPGEIAGFDDVLADKLIEGGFAVLPGTKGALKMATADVLVNPVDLDDDVVDVPSDTKDGNEPSIDTSTVVIEPGGGCQSSPAASETVTEDPGATDTDKVSGSDGMAPDAAAGTAEGSVKPRKSASGSTSDSTKKPTAKKA
ncbi:hypothetical protein EPIB1_1167 [Tritonibacter mobilis]|uniref:hypothetical protein n=1 Tax=Tritonibacter mobilis TaxID=379347 RepID=UPI000F6D45EE|nr:hypothetical protein [Tritonibacter mobilis]VCU58269.1 hypothetical protein EPIB1_1167 [Tritonibacter mobilis]